MKIENHIISLQSAVTVLYASNSKGAASPIVARLVPGQAIAIWDPSGDGRVTREVTIKRVVVETLTPAEGLLPAREIRGKEYYNDTTWVRAADTGEAVAGRKARALPALAEPSFAAATRIGADRPLFGAYPRATLAKKKAAEWGPVTGVQLGEFLHYRSETPMRDGMMLPCIGVVSGQPKEGFLFRVNAMEPEAGKFAPLWFKPLTLAAPGVNGKMSSDEFELTERMTEMAVRKKVPLFLAWIPFGTVKNTNLEFVPTTPLANTPKAAEAWAEKQGDEKIRATAIEFGCPAAAKFVLEGWDALTPEERGELAAKDARELVELLRAEHAETAAQCWLHTDDPVSELPSSDDPATGVLKMEAAARAAVARNSTAVTAGADLGL